MRPIRKLLDSIGRQRRWVLGFSFAAAVGVCGAAVLYGQPQNRAPVLFDLSVFPPVIGPSDSAIVICHAMDPDADTLVYDWITDARLRIKGAPPGEHSLYHTSENARIFYPRSILASVDSPWVQCFARDRRGMSANRVVRFVVSNRRE